MDKFNGYDVDAVGWPHIAFYALSGDGSPDALAIAARTLQARLGDAGKVLHDAGQYEDNKTVAAANLLMIAIGEMLDPEGVSEYKIEIKRRRKGKPINRHERALRGYRAAGIVRKLEAAGWKTEAAVEQATADTGLSRAEVFAWHSWNKKALAMTPEEFAESQNAPITKTD